MSPRRAPARRAAPSSAKCLPSAKRSKRKSSRSTRGAARQSYPSRRSAKIKNAPPTSSIASSSRPRRASRSATCSRKRERRRARAFASGGARRGETRSRLGRRASLVAIGHGEPLHEANSSEDADRDERDAHRSNDPTESPERELAFEDL